jgi:L-alanine-DL-glutamate epimerase-like enolase superfamily enzyme
MHRLRTSFENVRRELGFDYDIMVYCHNEHDLPSAKAMAQAVEGIEPEWFEDPLPPQFSDNWVALKRECRVPLPTGEKREMPQGFYTFLKEQAVDYIYPDIAFRGGITGVMKIANLAAIYRIPVATHNVGGIWLTMCCVYVGLSIMDFLTSEGAMGGAGGGVLAMAKVPPEVKGGFAAKPEAPGLGVDLNEEVYKQRQGGRGGSTVPLDWVLSNRPDGANRGQYTQTSIAGRVPEDIDEIWPRIRRRGVAGARRCRAPVTFKACL